MKNLDNFGMVELKKEEMRKVEGGIWGVILAYAMVYAWQAWNINRAY